MSVTLMPMSDRVFLTKIQTEKIGNLHLPTGYEEESFVRARVEFAGEGFTTASGNLIPVSVKTGDTVLLSKHAGTKVRMASEGGEKEYLVVRETEILAVEIP